MSILFIRTLTKLRQNYQINSVLKLTSRSLGITPLPQQKAKPKNETTLVTSASGDRTEISTDVRPIGERIKENTKTASYFGVIIFGIGVTGVIMFVVFRELFSSSSPNNVYSDALKACVNVSLLMSSLNWIFEKKFKLKKIERILFICRTLVYKMP